MTLATRTQTARGLIKANLPKDARISFTRELQEGYLAIYYVGEGVSIQERAAFFSIGQAEDGPVVHEVWNRACEME